MNTPSADDVDPGRLARDLLTSRFEAVLSTLATEPAEQPFGSVVPYCLDQTGHPLLLLSHLAQHTTYLTAHPRCSLTILAAGGGDLQQRSRLTCLGQAHPVAASEGERYLNHFPQGRMYLEQLNFRCYRIEPERFHWNGGFATARWLGTDRVVLANPFAVAQEQAIIEHMNTDHSDALRRYLTQAGVTVAPEAEVTMVGMDGEGIDLRMDADLCRIPLPHPVSDLDGARQVLVQMAQAIPQT
jgi:putative heme iron utilization protein